MYPYVSCAYISYLCVYCICTFRIRDLSKSIINMHYQSPILISVAVPVFPVHIPFGDGDKAEYFQVYNRRRQPLFTHLPSHVTSVSSQSISKIFLHNATDTSRYNICFILCSITPKGYISSENCSTL